MMIYNIIIIYYIIYFDDDDVIIVATTKHFLFLERQRVARISLAHTN